MVRTWVMSLQTVLLSSAGNHRLLGRVKRDTLIKTAVLEKVSHAWRCSVCCATDF
jgi:hypothetical protein